MFKALKKKLYSYPDIIKFLRFFYHSWIPPTIPLQHFLNFFNQTKTEVRFIQIGSNDGKSNDPIHKYLMSGKWKGILVEPVDYVFNRLKDTYKEVAHNLDFINAAISAKDGYTNFYSIKETNDESLPEWYDQLGSFDKEVILKHKNAIPHIEELIEEKQVVSMSFQTLCKVGNFHYFDFLHIDTEGFDYEIIKMIDWAAFKPGVILFEHRHLSQMDHKKSIRLLKANHYKVFLCEGDTIAIERKVCNSYNHN